MCSFNNGSNWFCEKDESADATDLMTAAETDLQDATATQADIARIIDSIRLRDERIIRAESELKKLNQEFQTLRRELVPVFLSVKGLPPHPSHSPYGGYDHEQPQTDVTSAPPGKTSLKRMISTKVMLGLGPKSSSPTHIPPAFQDSRDGSKLDPSVAAVAASNHLGTSISGQSQLSPGHQQLPSPTSPPHHRNGQTLAQQTFGHPNNAYPRSAYNQADEHQFNDRDLRGGTPGPNRSQRQQDPSQQEPPRSDGSTGGQSAEIFKSFRVSMEDPCYKVLPAALKKYNINADWRQYALYIVYGDEERCLEMEEKPLILFKQLDKEGRKPMFMLRKIAPLDGGHTGQVGMSNYVGSSINGSGGGGRSQAYQSGVPVVPGGVL